MLQSFGLNFKPWTDFGETFRSEMTRQSKVPIDFQYHTLLTARLVNDKSDATFVDYLDALYAENPPDLIVALGAPAANFVQRYRASLISQGTYAILPQMKMKGNELGFRTWRVCIRNLAPSVLYQEGAWT